jgi:hypothetical protein
MGVGYNPKIVTDGLVLCLDAANRKSYPGSGTTWTDLSGRGVNGTLTNGPTFDTGNSGSIVFDGTNDFVNVDSQLITTNTSFTICCSVYFTNWSDNSFKPLIDGGNLGSGTTSWTLSKNTSNELFIAVNSGYISLNPSISNNTWYHVTATATAGTPYVLKLYINGIERTPTSTVNSNSLTVASQPIRIFASSFSAIYTAGRASNVQIYNRALSAIEVQQNFNSLRGRYGI